MRTLLILIIAGFVLLSLGSPEKVSESITRLTEVVKQFPEKEAAWTTKSDAQQTGTRASESIDFTSVGQQEDIPASEVLASPITPATATVDTTSLARETSFDHRDKHTIADVQAVNSEALKILDRIAASYQ